MAIPNNRIERVAIVGASGTVGKPITEALLATGKHTVTALTRGGGSVSSFPAGVKTAVIDYDDEDSIVSALKGQQFLIISLSVHAKPDTHHKLVVASAKAGVPYVMPNCYGGDILNESLKKEGLVTQGYLANIRDIEEQGVSSWISLCCSFWYDYSLAVGLDFYGFDFKEKKVILYDDGLTKINTSTFAQCGRAVAALLSLPVTGEGDAPTVSKWKNKPLFISSFLVSQRDMLDSANRVLGTTDTDWTITYEPSAERYKNGLAAMGTGDRRGFARALYARAFFPGGGGDYESTRGTANKDLDLPVEDLDEMTKVAIDHALGPWVDELFRRYNGAAVENQSSH